MSFSSFVQADYVYPYATTPTVTTGSPSPTVTTGSPSPTVTTGSPADTSLNPFNGITNLCELVNALIKVVVQFGSVIAVIFVIWSGFLFIRARGNKNDLDIAKKTLYTTVIGLAILLGSSVIARIIMVTLANVVGGGSTTCTL
jgi:type IV secretory pathway VirB2 component (pilin)